MHFRSTSIIGIFTALIFFVALLSLTDGHIASILWNPFGFVLVLGGSIIATLLSHQNISLTQLHHALKGFFMNDTSTQEATKTFLKLAKKVQMNKLAEVENDIPHIHIPFLRVGLQLLIDNARTEDIVKVLSFRINRARENGRVESNLFHSMANYAPAFGMLGTLVGLLGMLGSLGSGDLSQIGLQMAVALVTTFYGIILANLVFRPIATQLERRTEHQVYVMRVLAEAVILMNMGRSATQVRGLLSDITSFYEDELSDGVA